MIKNIIISYVFDYVHRQPYEFLQDNLSGSLTNNIIVLSDNIEKISNNIIVRILRGIIQVIVAFLAMYCVHPFFSWALAFWATGFIYISLKFSRKISSYSAEYAKSQSRVSGKMVDSIANFSNVRIFARANFESQNLRSSLAVMKKQYQNKEWFLIKFHYAQGCSITCLMGAMAYLLIKLRINNQITIGDFAFILGLSFYAIENVWTITEQIDQMNDIVGRCNQSIRALFKPIVIQDTPRSKPLIVSQGKIIFDNVEFYYNSSNPLFYNESTVLLPGQKTGLVGYSGSGKSTFASLMLRHYDVISGRILIDSQDIRDVTQNSLHGAIGVIPQDPFLFNRSLMENIRYGRIDANDDEVITAAKHANIHDFIIKLPQGYNTLVGERGVKISGGQRQQIAIARIILKNPPILILDEATSQLDFITENVIKEALNKLMQGKTTIIIAHRLSTLLNVDKILVFEQGKIIQEGTHYELLLQTGLYKKLWDSQS